MHTLTWVVATLVLIFLVYALGFIGYREFIIEKPAYIIIEKNSDYEVREYDSYITASYTRDSGDINNGFMAVAEYIFGGNSRAQKVAMTSPVIDSPTEGQKIAMTSPVIDTPEDGKQTTSFVLPSEYSLNDLPTPNNQEVKIAQVPVKRWAVKRFLAKDFRDQAFLDEQRKELAQALVRDEKEFSGNYQYAFYDPPGLVWFLRRNEVWIELE